MTGQNKHNRIKGTDKCNTVTSVSVTVTFTATVTELAIDGAVGCRLLGVGCWVSGVLCRGCPEYQEWG